MGIKSLLAATGIALSQAATSGIAQMGTCYHKADIEAWTAPKNEPCYIHDGDVCAGYMVCCVKKGTCKSSGGTVSSTEEYYEGACVSDGSSKASTAAGCMGKVGECMEAVLTGVMGTTAHGEASGTTAYVTPSQTVIDRMAAAFETGEVTETSRYTGELETVTKVTAMKQPCLVWETYDVTITLDGAEMGDMSSLTSKIGAKIAEAAGVPGYHVECTAEATAEGVAPAGVVVTGQVHADELKAGEAKAAFLQNMGTAAQAEAMLIFPPTVSRYGTSTPGWNATVTKAPTIMQDNWYPSPPSPPSSPPDSGLSTGVIVGIAVGAGVGGILLLGGVAFLVMKSMAAKPAGSPKSVEA